MSCAPLTEQFRVVELTLIGDDVRERTGRRYEVVVADELAEMSSAPEGK